VAIKSTRPDVSPLRSRQERAGGSRGTAHQRAWERKQLCLGQRDIAAAMSVGIPGCPQFEHGEVASFEVIAPFVQARRYWAAVVGRRRCGLRLPKAQLAAYALELPLNVNLLGVEIHSTQLRTRASPRADRERVSARRPRRARRARRCPCGQTPERPEPPRWPLANWRTSSTSSAIALLIMP
jgi:hypothetical protein